MNIAKRFLFILLIALFSFLLTIVVIELSDKDKDNYTNLSYQQLTKSASYELTEDESTSSSLVIYEVPIMLFYGEIQDMDLQSYYQNSSEVINKSVNINTTESYTEEALYLGEIEKPSFKLFFIKNQTVQIVDKIEHDKESIRMKNANIYNALVKVKDKQSLEYLYFTVDVSAENYGYCEGKWKTKICQVAWIAIESQGLDPIAPHPDQMQFCGTDQGCISNIGAVMRLLYCESSYKPNAYNEGYVQGAWNESRGIAQIGNGWVHIATDEQAYNWVWSVIWVASDYTRSSKRWYPECGVDH